MGDSGDRLRLYDWEELAELPDPEPLIEGLIDAGAMSVVYGPSGSGKTFFATDGAIRVSLGWPVHGFDSRGGAVVYIAAELGRAFKHRIGAFAARHLAHDTAPKPEFAILPASVDLCNPEADTGQIIANIKARFRGDVALVVIDTLSRAIAGYNENSPEDMTAFVANCDRIRTETRAHVMVVHHTGKEIAAGSRGHSSLRAATDTEIEITRNEDSGVSTVKVTKQRDRAILDRLLSFTLSPVQFDDARGRKVASCVVEPAEASAEAPRRAKLSAASKVALDLLRRAIDEAGEVPPASSHIPAGRRCVSDELWRRYCREGSITDGDSDSAFRKAFGRSAEALQGNRLVGVWNGWVWTTDRDTGT